MFGSKNRQNTYVKADSVAATREQRLKKLKFELREHIRFLGNYPLLSADWLRMVDSLNQISNVAYMETQVLPTPENPVLRRFVD